MAASLSAHAADSGVRFLCGQRASREVWGVNYISGYGMRYGGDFNQHFPSAGMPWKHESWQLDFAVMRLLFEDPITSNVVCWYADGCESSDWLVNVGIRKSF